MLNPPSEDAKLRLNLKQISVAASATALTLVATPTLSQDRSQLDYSTASELSSIKKNFKTAVVSRWGLLSTYTKLVFEDNFDVPSVADATQPATAAKWFAPGHTTYGWAQFPSLTASPSTYAVQDGMLRLRMQKISGQWYGAHVSSVNAKDQGFTFSKGYVEVQMKVAQRLGGWSGFWMTSLDSPTTGMHGEIDVVESYGTATYGYSSSVHLWPGAKPPPAASQTHWAASVWPRTKVAADDQFHTYGCELTDDWIVYYLDGVETSRVPRGAEWNDAPFRLYLSVAGGPDHMKAQAVGPIDMYVDSVRVWT